VDGARVRQPRLRRRAADAAAAPRQGRSADRDRTKRTASAHRQGTVMAALTPLLVRYWLQILALVAVAASAAALVNATPRVRLALKTALAPAADISWHDDLEQPVTFGVRRPVVLLPARLRGAPPEMLRAVLCHELIHVDRHDWPAMIVEELILTALWFHPAV